MQKICKKCDKISVRNAKNNLKMLKNVLKKYEKCPKNAKKYENERKWIEMNKERMIAIKKQKE